jgi:hypothetical protein
MTVYYNYTLIHSPVFHLSAGMVLEPEEERAYEEYSIGNPELLQDIALNKLVELLLALRSQETITVQGKEYPAIFNGDGYFYEWELTGLLPTVLTVNASPGGRFDGCPDRGYDHDND